jgi:hypothetical protein
MIAMYFRAADNRQRRSAEGASAHPHSDQLPGRPIMDDGQMIHGRMEGACSESEKSTHVAAPKQLLAFSRQETIAASMLAPGNRRVSLPYSSSLRPVTRLADRFLPGNKKAPQIVFADSLRCHVSLFLPYGGQYDQRIYYTHLFMGHYLNIHKLKSRQDVVIHPHSVPQITSLYPRNRC